MDMLNGNGTALETVRLATKASTIAVQPNPFKAQTIIRADADKVEIFNLQGKCVAVLHKSTAISSNEFVWNAGKMTPGAYFARCMVKGRTITASLLLMK